MGESFQDRLPRTVDAVLAKVVELRHALHRNPELALEEHETAALIRRVLGECEGMRLLEPFLGTDVVAILEGGKGPGKQVALRADIDALPLHEETGLPYASERPGCMHACGHDGHTATLLGAALVLSRMRDAFPGSVRFIFQPGEEVSAAGKDLVAAGALGNPKPDAVFALHAWHSLPVGAIASKPGPFLAAADFFRITIVGRGGHGSMPEITVDPILTAARVVEALQGIVSRRISPLDPAVVSICRIAGGTNSNIIPDRVELDGTARYLNPDLGARLPALIEQIVRGVCDATGATFAMQYDQPYPPTINDAEMVAQAKTVAILPPEPLLWVDLDAPSMGGEDFCFYLHECHGAMFRLGMGEDHAPLHSARFDFNDDALPNGIRFLVALTLRVLGQENP